MVGKLCCVYILMAFALVNVAPSVTTGFIGHTLPEFTTRHTFKVDLYCYRNGVTAV